MSRKYWFYYTVTHVATIGVEAENEEEAKALMSDALIDPQFNYHCTDLALSYDFADNYCEAEGDGYHGPEGDPDYGDEDVTKLAHERAAIVRKERLARLEDHGVTVI